MYEIYSSDKNDEWRFALGKNGSRNLLVIGLNPSTATKEKSDVTIAKVEGAAHRNGFDGFVMLNLYPVRSTDFTKLPFAVDVSAFEENLAYIEDIVASNPHSAIWAAWGGNIYVRRYFVEAARELISRLQPYQTPWLQFGTLTKSGHPRHPSRLSYKWVFSELNIVNYLNVLSTV